MIQVNQYKKVCHLTDSEVKKINEFFEAMFEVKQISEIKIYIDTNNDNQICCDIIGLDEPETKVVGTRIKHDIM